MRQGSGLNMATDARRDDLQTGAVSPLTCILPGFLIVVAIAVGGGLLLVRCVTRSPADSYTTRVDALPEGVPVYLSGPGIYLVRSGTDVIALDQNEPRAEDASKGCVIRFREALERDGTRGLFRSDCSGALYDRQGQPLDPGGGPPMKRHPVTRTDASVTIPFKTCIDPGAGNATVPCKPR